jgi:glycosyltransferase involved in cell wall biosynthesis
VKLSIITPTYNRADGRLQRCITSIYNQSYRDFEHIIVDDGSKDETKLIVEALAYPNLTYVHTLHVGRVIARNIGMQAATGDFITWLDSDDAFDTEYAATIAYNAAQEPDVRLWVLGVVYHGMHKIQEGKQKGTPICPAWTKIRKPWMPPLNCDGAHTHFPSGKVGTGMFVFHRECWEKVGPMPPWKDHLQIADGVDEWLGYETGYSAAKRWVGNPYGDDWAYFRKLTQFYQVHLIHACLYIQYVR